MPDTDVSPPPAKTEIRVSKEMSQAEADVDAMESEPALNFGGGLSVHPTSLSGLDERRIRVASAGHFSTLGDVFGAMQKGSAEAVGAIYWAAKLKADGLTPDQAAGGDPPYTYYSCIEQMDLGSIAALAEDTTDVSPT